MARLVSKLSASTTSETLTPAQRAAAERRIAKERARNPLRRVQLSCHGWVRDPIASKGDFVWCAECADWVRVDAVAE